MSESAQALWYVSPGQAEIRAETLPPSAPGMLRIRTLHSALSRGTESLILGGRVPESEYERMRAPFMQGQFPFPVKYGYAAVGRVEAGEPSRAGQMVFALHPHQTLFDIPAENAVALPADVPPARAVLAANMETALNAVWDGNAAPATRIAVIGAGVVGSLVAYLCRRIIGTQVTLVDIDENRRSIAAALDVQFAAPGDAPLDCDLVFHASGHQDGLATALDCAGLEARVIELSWYGTDETSVTLGGAFHSRRLNLISSQVGRIAPDQRPRWSYTRRLAAALRLLADPALEVLIAEPVNFSELAARLPHLLLSGRGILCQRVDYQ